MSEIILIHRVVVFLIIALGIFLSFWVLSENRKNRLHQIFFIMTIFVLLWNLFAHLGLFAINVESAIFWYRLNVGTVSLFFIATYFFAIYFPKKISENKLLSKVVILLGGILFFLSTFTSLIVKDTILKEWGMEIIFGEGKFFFYGVTTILTFLILYIFIKKYFLLSRKEKLKVEYVLMGIFIFALMNFIFNVGAHIFLGTVRYQYFADYSAIFFLGFTAYAIAKQKLFEIKVVLTQFLVGLIAILLLVNIIVAETLFEYIWKSGLFIVFLFFGYLLIKSVMREIKQRTETQKLYEEVNRLSKAKSEFISITSHQLRTPLTAVKGYISMLIEGSYGKLSEKMEKPLKNIYQSNERLVKLVNDLLNLSRLETGKLELKLELTSLKKLTFSVIEELKINAEKKGLEVKIVKTTKPLPKIMVDQDKLRQVILNIIDNAVKYTKQGGITIELKKLDKWIQIKISDTGEGIDKKETKSLFQMFSRATAGNQLHIEGAGIGLYVAKKFIEIHQGKIWVESPGKGKGSTFYIELPIK